jgi:beta-lactamase superfamily II metal-dependent hydrolase
MNPRRRSFSGAFLLLALALALAIPSGAVTPNGKLQIIHLDVGQGDGAVLITPLGETAMIDDGGATFPSFPCWKILAQLDTLGITHIDYHFASHYHSDHIGCFPTIDNEVDFYEGWDRAGSYSTTAYGNYVNALGARRYTLTKGQVFTLGAGSAHPVTITCIDFNSMGNNDYENSKSVVLRVDYGYFSESFGGDLQGYSGSGRYDYETPFSSEVDTVMVYKVHHHGSRYSSNDTWLDNTAPMGAIISVGDGNSYGHPTPEVLGRLHNHQVRTYWTERGSTSGASPDPIWDKVAHGRITIDAAWEGQGKTVISGGYGASAFCDTLTNPGPPSEGACCNLSTGTCTLTTQASCLPPAEWHCEWTCSPNPCLPSDVVEVSGSGADASIGAAPNPFWASTVLWYRLSTAEDARLEIFDASGRSVRMLELGAMSADLHSVEWDGRGPGGNPVGPGVYFARLSAGERSWTRTLMRIR